MGILQEAARGMAVMGIIVTADMIAVIAATGIDFLSGIARARREGIKRTSRGFRRTVTKLGNYLLLMLGMLTVDGIIVLTSLLSRAGGGTGMVMIPLFTTVTSLSLTLIEAKSVSENAGSGNIFGDIMRIMRILSRFTK